MRPPPDCALVCSFAIVLSASNKASLNLVTCKYEIQGLRVSFYEPRPTHQLLRVQISPFLEPQCHCPQAADEGRDMQPSIDRTYIWLVRKDTVEKAVPSREVMMASHLPMRAFYEVLLAVCVCARNILEHEIHVSEATSQHLLCSVVGQYRLS